MWRTLQGAGLLHQFTDFPPTPSPPPAPVSAHSGPRDKAGPELNQDHHHPGLQPLPGKGYVWSGCEDTGSPWKQGKENKGQPRTATLTLKVEPSLPPDLRRAAGGARRARPWDGKRVTPGAPQLRAQKGGQTGASLARADAEGL